jgi:glycosyltransferase involved in cell wall biosynthesis
MDFDGDPLSVVVIVPVYNNPEGITQTLNSLKEVNLSTGSFEVKVVDNRSSDNTLEKAELLATKSQKISVITEERVQGSYAARNRGLESSDGDIYCFLDADETVGQDWLESALGEMENTDVDYLGCNVTLVSPRESIIGQYNVRTGFPVESYLEEQHYAPTCALLVSQEVFEKVGLFDARLISGGDREFGERVHEAGYKQGYAEDATVYHPARTSFESLAKKNFRVGRGFCQKQRYYPERYGKPGIPPKPSGSGSSTNTKEEKDDEYAPTSLFERFAFAFLSIAMLASRGLGYYYEFFFGDERDDIPAPTTS